MRSSPITILLLALVVVTAAPVPAGATDVPVSGQGPFTAPNGPSVTLDAGSGTNLNFSELFPDSNTVVINTSNGRATFTSTGRTNVSVSTGGLEGTWTNVSQLDVATNNLTVDPDDKAPFTVGQQADNVSVRDSFGVDDGTVDFVYGGQSGQTLLQIRGVASNTQLGAVDADTGTILDTATSDNSGVVTFDELDNSEHAVTLQTNSGGPSFDNTSASPQGNTTLRSSSETLSIDVDDSDFPDDTVSVEFYVNGSSVGTTTVNNAGTASMSVSGLSEGTHQWYAAATDGYGASATSDTFTFTVDHYDPSVSNPSPSGNPTIRYSNETLSVDVSDRDFTLDGDNVSVEFTVDGTVVGTKSVTANGTASVSVTGLSDGQHDWSATAMDEYGGTDSTATESFTVDHYKPNLSDPFPDGNLNSEPSQANVSVTDGDFPKDGDTVDVYFEIDGQDVGSDTLSANGTASTPISSLTGGEHNLTISAQDSYGQWTNQTYAFAVPDVLRIYKEEKPTELIDNATTEIRFYTGSGDQAQIFERSTNNGTLNMTGLPAGESFVLVADADGYRPRRVFAQSLFETQEVFLLNDSVKFADVIFEIDDYTGEYPQDVSTLQVQRSLNGKWQTVEGDFFGANSQFPSQLRYNARHRLILYNVQTGEERQLGTFTPLQSGKQTVTVAPEGNFTLTGPGPQVTVRPSATQIPAREDVQLNVEVTDGIASTAAAWNVTVYYVNESANINTTLYEANYSDGTGSLQPSLNLSSRPGGRLVVQTQWRTNSGQTGGETTTYQVSKSYANQNSFLSILDEFIGLIAGPNQDVFSGTLAIFLTILTTAVVGTRYRLPTEMIGMVGVGMLTGFAIIGWLGYSIVFVAVVAWASIAYLRRRY